MNREKSKGKLMLNRSISLIAELAENDQDNHLEVLNEEDRQEEPKKQQTNVHQFILSEFKEKYDLLKSQFEAKKKEADGLLYDKKKLEIEILNYNGQYYQREIIRLRGEVQKYQSDNEQNKHKYFVAENLRKDLEATSRVRNDELKQSLKQLQKQKIAVVQLKHQITEKERNFNNIIEAVQKNNLDISEKFSEMSVKLMKTDNELKTKSTELAELKIKYATIEKEMNSKDLLYKEEHEKHELNQYRFKHRIDDLEEEIRFSQSTDNQKMKNLEEKVRQLEGKRKSQELLLTQKLDVAANSKNLRGKQEQIFKLEEQVREFQFLLNQKNTTIQTLQGKLKNVCSIQLLNESEQKYIDAMNKQKNVQRMLQNRISELQKEKQIGKLNNHSSKGYFQDPRSKTDFQQLLRNQIEQNSKLKIELSMKIDEVFSLKNVIEELHIKQSLMENQIDILKKKQKANQKNSKIGFEIEAQNLKNDIQTIRRKLEVTESKFNIKMKEVKDKDAFITSVLIGRSKQQDVPFVAAELKRIFEAEYVSKLSEANIKIADLQAKLDSK